MAKVRNRQVLVFLILILIVLLVFVIDVNTGFTTLALSDIWAVVSGTASKAIRLTLIDLRLPRILTAMLVGVGLSTSGCILQGVSRNQLADPGILGINAGAGLAIILFISFATKNMQNIAVLMPIVALIGATITMVLIYLLSYIKNESLSPNRLVLTGVALSAALTSTSTVFLLRLPQSQYTFVQNWLSGNIWGASWSNVKIMAPCILVLLFYTIYKSRTLNILELGEQTATGLGVSVQKESAFLLMAGVGLAGICVAVGGGIAFVGLICPHLARRLVGSRHEVLIPASALTGAALLIISDILSRTLVSPDEISIGVVVAVVGAPYFLYLLARLKR